MKACWDIYQLFPFFHNTIFFIIHFLINIFNLKGVLENYLLFGVFIILIILQIIITNYKPKTIKSSQNKKLCKKCKKTVNQHAVHCYLCGRCIDNYDNHFRYYNNCLTKSTVWLLILILIIYIIFIALIIYFNLVLIIKLFKENNKLFEIVLFKKQYKTSDVIFIYVLEIIINLMVLIFIFKQFIFLVYLKIKGLTTFDYYLLTKNKKNLENNVLNLNNENKVKIINRNGNINHPESSIKEIKRDSVFGNHILKKATVTILNGDISRDKNNLNERKYSLTSDSNTEKSISENSKSGEKEPPLDADYNIKISTESLDNASLINNNDIKLKNIFN